MATIEGAEKSLPYEVRFPELFNDAPSIDRSKCKREVPMKVLALGLMRTGTTSMKAALEVLGFREVYHMNSLLHDPGDSKWWTRAVDAKYNGKGSFGQKEWDQLLGNCQASALTRYNYAVCDMPPALFAPELVAAYPEAKVVLLSRDVDAWYTSCSNTVFRAPKSRRGLLARLIIWLDRDHMRQTLPVVGALVSNFLGPKGAEYENAKEKYFEHYDTLRKVVPKDSLLEYKVQDGWGPLCEFLDVPKPEIPFPRINEGDSFNERREVIMEMARQRVIKKYLPHVVLGIALGLGALGFKFV